MADGFERVASAVLDRVTPDAEERGRLEAVVETVTERTEAAIADLPVAAEPVHVGSTARDTWIAGDLDVDVFVRFPTELPREDLETYGLRVGHAVLPDGHEEYAEHPYVRGTVDGFAVDLVPCYAVEDATAVRSAVDRTPFHTTYLEERIDDERAAEIRVFKQLLKGIGVYGSDLRTRGFSGYLTELLVLAFGTAEATLSAVADWHPPVRLDPADHGEAAFEDPLVLIDPTDPARNVAAVCSPANLARLQHHARAVLRAPSVERFFPEPVAPLDAAAVRAHVERRGTTALAVRFTAPALVDDDLYPQLRKSLSGIRDELARRGFAPVRSGAFAAAATDAGREAVLLLELATGELPAVERHAGPPVHVREHAEAFCDRYAEDDAVYGPFVDGDRYVVERPRAVRSARAFLESEALAEVRLGAALAEALLAERTVLEGEELGALADAFGAELAAYFDPSP